MNDQGRYIPKRDMMIRESWDLRYVKQQYFQQAITNNEREERNYRDRPRMMDDYERHAHKSRYQMPHR